MTERAERPSLLLHTLGLTLAFSGAALVLSALVEVLMAGTDDWVPLLLLGGLVLFVGWVMWKLTTVPRRIPLLDVFATVAAAWVTLSVVGAAPYLLTGTLTQLDQALFESVSGFTTTGATVLVAGDDQTRYAASDGILFWRAISQWMGGMGVIALVIAVLPSVGSWGMGMMAAEAPGPTGERLTPRVRSTARRLWGVYIGFTILLAGAYLVAGMDLYEAVTHSFTTVSTGGFSPYTASIAHFDSQAVEWIVIVAMFVAGTSFTMLYKVLRGRPGPMLRSVEFRTYCAVVAVATAVVFITADPAARDYEGFRDSLFTVLAIVSTTGYASVDFVGGWSDAAKSVLLILMPLGAMAGSTAGGVKMIRILAVASFAHRSALAQLHQRLVRPVRVGSAVLDNNIANQVVGHLILSLAAFGGGSLLIALTGMDLVTAFSASATSFGNVGPGLGRVGSDFLAVPLFGRLVAIVLMLLGRLEIYPILLALVKLPIPRARPLVARLRQQVGHGASRSP
ncbi:MAG: TrkH family potassium uptake protein [Actinomycetota bacterium]